MKHDSSINELQFKRLAIERFIKNLLNENITAMLEFCGKIFALLKIA